MTKFKIITKEEIKEMRKRTGMTAKAFAHLLKVCPNTIHRWEGGSKNCVKLQAERVESLVETVCNGYSVIGDLVQVFIPNKTKRDKFVKTLEEK